MSTSTPPVPPAKSGTPWTAIIIGVLVVLVLVCGGACGGCYMLANSAAKQAREFAEVMLIANVAQTSVAADPAVQEKLGDALTINGIPKRQGTGPIDFTNTVVMYDIVGPKGNATVTAHAAQENGGWQITKISVTYADGTIAEVSSPETTAPQLNF